MTTFDNLTSAQRTRAALHRDVRSVCTETGHLLGLEVTSPAVQVVAELLYRKLAVYGRDLEAFAKHAKRTTINSDDVKLLSRRNPSLRAHLHSIAPVNTSAPKKRQRSSVLPNSKPADTPAKVPEDASTKDIGSKKDEDKQNGFALDGLVDNMAVDNMIDLTFD